MNYRERSAIIVMMMKDGARLSDVGELYGISRQRVCQILQAAGVPPDIGQRKRTQRRVARLAAAIAERMHERRAKTEVRLETILAMQRQGMTQTEIGARLGMTQRGVSQYLIYYGIRSRTYTTPRAGK